MLFYSQKENYFSQSYKMKVTLVFMAVCGVASGRLQCRPEQFECDNGICIPADWLCDTYNDCIDNSDERGCPCDGFKCANEICVPDNYVCDGDDDCGDWSDENEDACPCLDDEFRCPSLPGSEAPGDCIPPQFVCDDDDIWDCFDGSDQENCTAVLKQPSHKDGSLRLPKMSGFSFKNIAKMGKKAKVEQKDRARRN